jgi:hypothetical protein
MRYATAAIAFLSMFALGFVLGGWFLMPHLPPVPDHPVGVFEAEYWTTNWAGALLGLVLGILSARSSLKGKPRVGGWRTSRCCGRARVASIGCFTSNVPRRVALPATERHPLSRRRA